MDSYAASLRIRAYREGQRAPADALSEYQPGSMLDRAWKEGHRDVHVYGIKKFHPTDGEKAMFFVGFVAVVITIAIIMSHFIRN